MFPLLINSTHYKLALAPRSSLLGTLTVVHPQVYFHGHKNQPQMNTVHTPRPVSLSFILILSLHLQLSLQVVFSPQIFDQDYVRTSQNGALRTKFNREVDSPQMKIFSGPAYCIGFLSH
jgi:hypothetical protein